MNQIMCENCGDCIVPVEEQGIGLIRKCNCGSVRIRAVPMKEGLPWIVEVKLFDRVINGQTVKGHARVIKINNFYLVGHVGVHEFTDEQKMTNDLFYQNKSQIVITSLDTPGVKLVTEWGKGTHNTTEQKLILAV